MGLIMQLWLAQNFKSSLTLNLSNPTVSASSMLGLDVYPHPRYLCRSMWLVTSK